MEELATKGVGTREADDRLPKFGLLVGVQKQGWRRFSLGVDVRRRGEREHKKVEEKKEKQQERERERGM